MIWVALFPLVLKLDAWVIVASLPALGPARSAVVGLELEDC